MRTAPPSTRSPVATFRDTDSTPKEAFVWHAAGLFRGAGFQPASYIDSIILRDRDIHTGGRAQPRRAISRPKRGALESHDRRVYPTSLCSPAGVARKWAP
ncbi:MAG: hypothetical protein IT433_13220 [Phycisphaerales bacterium]|nr:hypothetical protein [Phycisphaerales bacterium]